MHLRHDDKKPRHGEPSIIDLIKVSKFEYKAQGVTKEITELVKEIRNKNLWEKISSIKNIKKILF